MEYKGFDFKPGNVYNFQSADGLAQVSPAQPDAAPTEAASYATSAGDLAYQKFSEWLTRALDELGFSPDLSPFLLETLHNQGDIYTLLCDLCSADGIDISIIREMADEINAQYVLVHTAYGSSEGRDEKGDTASDVDCGIDGSADPEADVCDDEETEGFNFIEKAIELEEYLETRYGATGQSTAFSADSIWQALCLCSGEVEHSCQLLESVLQALNECRPCRHLLQGGCFRSDCRFNHDLSSVPCRYWLLSASGCTLEQCPFSHNIEVVVSTISADTNSNGTTTFSGIIEDSHFPQLGATASDVSSKSLSYARKVAGSAVSYKDAASSKQCVQSSTSNPSLYQMKIGAPTSGKMVCKDETFGISDWVTSGSDFAWWIY